MTNDELKAEIKALDDLYQRLHERHETFSRRLYRHFDAGPGGGKTDYRLTMTSGRRKTRDDEDDGDD